MCVPGNKTPSHLGCFWLQSHHKSGQHTEDEYMNVIKTQNLQLSGKTFLWSLFNLNWTLNKIKQHELIFYYLLLSLLCTSMITISIKLQDQRSVHNPTLRLIPSTSSSENILKGFYAFMHLILWARVTQCAANAKNHDSQRPGTFHKPSKNELYYSACPRIVVSEVRVHFLQAFFLFHFRFETGSKAAVQLHWIRLQRIHLQSN